jgi:hypothetical protein
MVRQRRTSIPILLSATGIGYTYAGRSATELAMSSAIMAPINYFAG